MDFTPDSEIQLNFFENSIPKHSPLMEVIDKINKSFGKQKIKFAGQDLKRV
jgi:DNA polymerase V